jgi:mono/diheme cytochrome c family protein
MKTTNRFSSLVPQLQAASGLALMAAAIYGASLAFAAGADPKPKDKAAKKPDGAALYAIHCNRCHAERYATEFTAAQWKTLMTHMRVRANLPAAQAKLILKYLQEESGN